MLQRQRAPNAQAESAKGMMIIAQGLRGVGKAASITEFLFIFLQHCITVPNSFVHSVQYIMLVRTLLSGGLVVTQLDMQLQRSWVRLLSSHFQVTTLGKLFTHVPLSPSNIMWYWSRDSSAPRLGR